MEFDDPLASDASSLMKGPHMGPPTNNICGNVIPMVCQYSQPAEFVVDPHVPHVRRSVYHQVYHDEPICSSHLIIL